MKASNVKAKRLADQRNSKKIPEPVDEKYLQPVICKVCFQEFACTTRKANMEQHWESKHPKKELFECFDEEILMREKQSKGKK